jgi:arylsulfatase A-like enzyme
MRIFKMVAAVVLTAELAGSVIAVVESALIVVTSGESKEYWLFLFGIVAYGAIGVLLSSGPVLLWTIIRRGRPSDQSLVRIAFASGIALPALAVGRYHVVQRVFHEQLVMLSPVGILTHFLLLFGAAIVAGFGAWFIGAAYRRVRVVGFAGIFLCALGAAWVAGMMTEAPEAAVATHGPGHVGSAGTPNVILVIVDTLRADAIEPYGARRGSTPGFVQLAQDSVTLEHVFSQASWTRPAIASILTSDYPTTHHAVHKFDFLPDEAFTLAEAMRQQGYWTAGFVTNINIAPVFNYQQGFDEYHYLDPSFYFGATDSATKLAVYKGLRVVREKITKKIYFQHYYQDAAVLNDRAVKWLRSKPPEPFFLLLHYNDPHDPYFEIPYNGHGVARVAEPDPAPGRADELHDLYLEDVAYLDEHLNKFIAELRAQGMYDRSVIAVTADHGEEFQEHGGWWHGVTLYDEVLHVPLLLKRAPEPQAGQRIDDVMRSIDIAPTLMASIGAEVPNSFQGHDVFHSGPAGPIVSETDLEGNQVTSIRDGAWKLIIANAENPRGLAAAELYNVSDDPRERQNLATREADRVMALRAKMKQILSTAAGQSEQGVTHAREERTSDPGA